MKRNLPSGELLSEPEMANACYTEQGFQTAEDGQLLAAAYSCLDQESRELVLLKYGQELTFREIADITGLPMRTIQTKLRKAVKTMHNTLDGKPSNKSAK